MVNLSLSFWLNNLFISKIISYITIILLGRLAEVTWLVGLTWLVDRSTPMGVGRGLSDIVKKSTMFPLIGGLSTSMLQAIPYQPT